MRCAGRTRRMRVGGGLLMVLGLFAGCARLPQGVVPVDGVDLDRYLGTWHEIARLDHSFERGLTRVTATYSRNKDGSIRVVNRGFDPARGAWRQAEGRARPVGGAGSGRLRVSFFGPFYGGYNIIELDKAGYTYALVCGNSRSYLWILARTPQLDQNLKDNLLRKARDLGFETDGLIFVEQDAVP